MQVFFAPMQISAIIPYKNDGESMWLSFAGSILVTAALLALFYFVTKLARQKGLLARWTIDRSSFGDPLTKQRLLAIDRLRVGVGCTLHVIDFDGIYFLLVECKQGVTIKQINNVRNNTDESENAE